MHWSCSTRISCPPFTIRLLAGGTIPLEAQRLGLKAYASDLNLVAVLINKAMIEMPPKFAGHAPSRRSPRSEKLSSHTCLIEPEWVGAQGLAEDVRHYGQWMRDEAEKRIGSLYPKIAVTLAMAAERLDLRPYMGRELTVIVWLWVRVSRTGMEVRL